MIDGTLLSQEIQKALEPWNGVRVEPFCQAIGNGIANALSGKLMFATIDVGVVAGSGNGTGAGISGLVPTNIGALIYSTGQKLWSPHQRDGPGTQWLIFCNKIGKGVALHLKTNAILQSVHSPVAAGNGKVSKYMGVTADDMKAAIVAAAPDTWSKARFPELAEAVATGIMTEILGHSPSDAVSIVGAPNGIPAGGGGVGNGTVL